MTQKPMPDFSDLVQRWDGVLGALVPSSVVGSMSGRNSLMFTGATMTAIKRAEQRLGFVFPDDLTSFLLASNGLLNPASRAHVLGVDKIGPLSVLAPSESAVISENEELQDCDPAETYGSRAEAGTLSPVDLINSTILSEVSNGQLICLLQPNRHHASSVLYVAYDFWDVPRLYSSFAALLEDELERARIALTS